jgi:hypothetical protein
VKRHVKASPAGSTQRQTSGLGRLFRGAVATRGDSPRSEGIGAPSRRGGTLALSLILTALALLALAPSASAIFTRARTASFGIDGTAATSFPHGVFEMTVVGGRLYVETFDVASNTSEIYAYEMPSRTPVGGAFPLSVPGTGGLAVDGTTGPAAGNIYYATAAAFAGSGPAGGELYGFDETGAPLGGNFPVSLGLGELNTTPSLGVDPAGNLFLTNSRRFEPYTRNVTEYDSLGNRIGDLPGDAFHFNHEGESETDNQGEPYGLAFDSAGDLFLSEGHGGFYSYTAASGFTDASLLAPAWNKYFVSEVAADRSTDRIYAAYQRGYKTNSTEPVDSNVSVFDGPSGSFLYSFGEQSLDGRVAVDEATDEVYVDGPGNKIDVYGPRENLANASATLAAAENVTVDSAELKGTVTDNNTLSSNWRLEISSDGGVTWSKVSAGKTEGGESNVAVSGTASKLIANTDYEFRIVTNKGTAPSDAVASTPLSFKTVGAPAVITDVGAVEVSDTSARLVGSVDPLHSATTYAFEYGTTPALGSSTAPLAIGNASTPIVLSQVVEGLSPGTTYYLRVTATNDFGTSEGDIVTFQTRLEPLPNPTGRAYEQVTPVDKNYGDANSGFGINRAGSSLDGNAVGFCTSNQFGEPPSQMTGLCAAYISRRTPSGWKTPNVIPPYCHIDPVTGEADGLSSPFPSPDFSSAILMRPESPSCPIPPLDPAAPTRPEGVSYNLYREDLDTESPNYRLLNPATEEGTKAEVIADSQLPVGGSDDFSHIVYQSRTNQTAPPDSPAPGLFRKLYEWDNGTLRLASKDINNEPFTAPSEIPAIGSIRGGSIELASAVSDDGRRIYFENPAPKVENTTKMCEIAGCEVYMREDGAETFDVSASECTSACGEPQTKADDFLSATPDGGKAFFTSCAKLSDESAPEGECTAPWSIFIGAVAGSKLYRWDRGGSSGHKLVDLTADHEPSDGVQPVFLGLVGESEDGDTAYFVTRGQIVAGAPTFPSKDTPGGKELVDGAKLYRWRWNGGSPSVEYIGPYQTRSSRLSPDMNYFQEQRPVSADGNDVMIYTNLRYDPAADHDTDADAYRWDASKGWTCVSCQPPGDPSGGNVDLTDVWNEYTTGFLAETGTVEPRTYMSKDGQRIFFGTPDALVPEDVNGEQGCPKTAFTESDIYTCEDVYEWHDGTVSLVSSGTGAEPVQVIGASRTGDNIFFYTRQSLVGWDVDDNVDIYDSRIGGGFPEPPAQPPSCEGEACRGAGSSVPPPSGAGTAVFQGPGNSPSTSKRCPKAKREVKRKGKVSCVTKKQHNRSAKRHHRNAKHNRRAGR